MANTTTEAGRFITITGLDADWNIATDLSKFAKTGMFVKSISFVPSATNDVMVIREGSGAAAPKIYHFKAQGADDYDSRTYSGHKGNGQRMFPYITISQCTLSSAANASVTFELG